MRTVPPIDCPNCRVELEEDRFCPYCGLQQPLRLAATPMGEQVGVEWRGVYPGMCVDPEACRGYNHCPRNYSCCE